MSLNNPSSFDSRYSPVIVNNLVMTTGTAVIWTPAAGKKFRLLGYSFAVTGESIMAVAGELSVSFVDGATAIPPLEKFYIPAVALNKFGADRTSLNHLGNGYLSGAINNALSVKLVGTLTAGNVIINVMGTEE